jgi:cell wall-associated NlpC family hydrolase
LRAPTPGCRKARPAAFAAGLIAVSALAVAPPAFGASGHGGSSLPIPKLIDGGGVPVANPMPAPAVGPGAVARISSDGRTAVAPAAAPEPVKRAIYAANAITRKPYRYGGGHRRARDSGYDCSGAVSFALRGAGVLARPLHSRAFMHWGSPGVGRWITVYTNPGHAFVVIAGLRFDTSGAGERGPRWRRDARSSHGYTARHVDGL